MTLRDIKEIFELIKFRINLGLNLDSSIFLDFEKKIKHKNYIFSKILNFIYEYFNFEHKLNNSLLSKSVQFLGKNKLLNNSFKKIADQGLIRFKTLKEINSNKKYREFEVDFKEYLDDLIEQKEKIRFSDLELIFQSL